jgi:hypothetical protein
MTAKPATDDPRARLVATCHADWDEVAELAVDAYRLTAPKRLLALLDQPPARPDQGSL